MEIKCVTWNKDSHGLFDYESKQIEVTKKSISSNSKIVRNIEDQKISIIDKNSSSLIEDETK